MCFNIWLFAAKEHSERSSMAETTGKKGQKQRTQILDLDTPEFQTRALAAPLPIIQLGALSLTRPYLNALIHTVDIIIPIVEEC